MYLFALAWSGRWKGKTNEEIVKDIHTHTQQYASDTVFRDAVATAVSKSNSLDSLLQNLLSFVHEDIPGN
jgi:uncharacterized protein YuzB (UPF0349 family)